MQTILENKKKGITNSPISALRRITKLRKEELQA
jgi:hypothetical protein